MVIKDAIALRTTSVKLNGHMKCGTLCCCVGYCTPVVFVEDMESLEDTKLDPLPEIGEQMPKNNADVEPFIDTSELPSISQILGEFECKPCVVLLRRLHQDAIEFYTTKGLSSQADTLESDHLSLSYRLEKKTKQKQKLFEKYKLVRQNYQKRKIFSHKQETSEVFPSETEFEEQNSELLKKKKGRNRKRLAYEDDLEWSPDGTKNLYSPNYRTKVNKATKMLRQNTRRKIIDSASSDSEDERLYEYYWEEFSQNIIENAMSKTVEDSASQKTTVSANSVPDKTQRTESNPENYDVLSKIIEEMDSRNIGMPRKKFGVPKKALACQSNSFTNCNFSPEKRQKRKRKVSVMGGKFVRSDSSPNTVLGVVQDIVNLVCSVTETGEKDAPSNITMKVCRSCSTPFSNSQANEQLCIICKDLKGNTSCRKKMATKQQKLNKSCPKSPKIKSKVKNRLLKIVPKGDMQRLLYADKTDKLSLEKGYNHCKNISKQNDEKISNEPSAQSRNSNAALTKVKSPESKKNATKNKKLQMNKKNHKVTKKKTKCTLNESESNLVKCSSAVNSDCKLGENLPQNHVSVTNVAKGLFLMTFPEPDKELDMEGNLSKLSSKKQSEVLPKVTAAESKSSVTSVTDTTEKSASDSGKYGNYIMSPMPTVVVANYSADDKKGDYHLSSVFYQNDSTTPTRPQLIQKPVHLNVVTNRPQLSITPILTRNQSPLTPSLHHNLVTTSSYIPTSVTQTSVLIRQPVTNIALSTPRPLIINPQNTMCRITNTNTGLTNVLTSNIQMQNNVPRQVTLIGNPYPDFSTVVQGSLNCNNESQLRITNVETVRTSYEVQNSQINPTEMYLSAETGEFLPKNSTSLSITNHLNNKDTGQAHSNSTLADASDILMNNAEIPTANLGSIVKGQTDLKSNLKDVNAKWKTGTANTPQVTESAQKSSPFNVVYEEIEAIGVLAVLDLEKNPSFQLNVRLESTKNELNKARTNSSDKITKLEFQVRILENAHRLMRQYGSFKRVSDHFLGKDDLIKIKKEILDEEEEQEGPSPCAFSKSPAPFPSHTDNSLPAVPQNLYKDPSPAAGPLERLQTQIASINHPVPTDFEPSSIMHHYPSASLVGGGSSAAAASAPMTPRNDFDSRKTPSRGSSGLRTPARPESATSQTEELTAAQIKQEKFDNAISSPSLCAFPQNTTLISSQSNTSQMANPLSAIASVANMPIMSNSVIAQPIMSNSVIAQPIMNNSVIAQQVNQQSIHQYRTREIPPNRTAPFDSGQNLARALLTMNPRNPNGNVVNVQQVYLPGNAGFPRAPAPVPSTLNSNNFVLRHTASSVNVTSGQIVVNNAQMSSQALYPVLSSAANQQVYNTNQQAYSTNQVYYNPQVPSSLVSSPSSYVVQNKPMSPEGDQMFCAVCNKVATLRCKQCAKVAYCNTTCAKTYWHKKHKMECRSTSSEL